uniref:C2H2-type domain-containing protein n=1 Tax=Ananas comosus var. bracteatus TaxID=296719 RepID=A0A6V7P360_ANACO|nr:unnamed protein product [Ananas comosus var. bracteatus]
MIGSSGQNPNPNPNPNLIPPPPRPPPPLPPPPVAAAAEAEAEATLLSIPWRAPTPGSPSSTSRPSARGWSRSAASSPARRPPLAHRRRRAPPRLFRDRLRRAPDHPQRGRPPRLLPSPRPSPPPPSRSAHQRGSDRIGRPDPAPPPPPPPPPSVPTAEPRPDGGGGGGDGDSEESEIVEIDAAELLAEHIHFCEICGKGFKRDANLRMHMRAHGDRFKTLEALSGSGRTAAGAAGPAGRKPVRFSCPFPGCNRNRAHRRFRPLKSAVCVKNHFKRSHCPKMYACHRCNKKSFSVLADLKSHLKHCGETPWRCSCGTSFSRKDKLFGHLALFEGHFPAVGRSRPRGSERKLRSIEQRRGRIVGRVSIPISSRVDGRIRRD